MKNKYYYIGTFPPPYGGATVKNEIMFRLFSRCEIEIYRTKNHKSKIVRNLLDIFALMRVNYDGYILGLSNSKYNRIVIFFLYTLRRKKLKNSILVVMGGEFANKKHILSKSINYQRQLRELRTILVETKEVNDNLHKMKIYNTKLIPNLRERPKIDYKVSSMERTMKCAFISSICDMKGVSIIFEAIKNKENLFVDFYGPISKEYEEIFANFLTFHKNAFYKGIITNKNDEIYSIINQYDVLLLPSMWKTEGIPGIIIEAKIAGVPSMISENCNKEKIIHDNVDGIVLKENTGRELENVLCRLQENENKLTKMKRAAKESSKQYFADNYKDEINAIF